MSGFAQTGQAKECTIPEVSSQRPPNGYGTGGLIKNNSYVSRTWSSQSIGQEDSPASRFPLYKPSPEPQYNQAPYGQEYRQDPHVTSLPSDRKIRKSAKIQLTDKALEDMPELQEDELRDFYAAVMDSGKPEPRDVSRIEAPKTRMGRDERQSILDGMARRLLSPSDQAGPSTISTAAPRTHQTVSKLVGKLRELGEIEVDKPSRVSLGLASRKEWEALLDETTPYSAADAAEELLELMSVSILVQHKDPSSCADYQSHGMYPAEAQVARVMERYSAEGRVTDVARLHDSMKVGESPRLYYKECGE